MRNSRRPPSASCPVPSTTQLSSASQAERREQALPCAQARLIAQAEAALQLPQQPSGLPVVVDWLLAAALLFLSIPLMLVIALIIRLDSPGPVLFRQTRMGQNRRRLPTASTGPERRQQVLLGRPFTFYKFRTMQHNAPELYPDLYDYQQQAADLQHFYFKTSEDPRLTRAGRWLRKTSLDELPNVLNVLKGDIALVGPRPEIPDMVPCYEPWQYLKFQVKPGITGYAQTNGRGLLSFQETVRYDVQYVLDKSWRTDVRVLAKTLWAVIWSFGAF